MLLWGLCNSERVTGNPELIHVGEKCSCVDRSKKSNNSIFACNQWRRVWSVPSGFNELRYVAEMAWKRSSGLKRQVLSVPLHLHLGSPRLQPWVSLPRHKSGALQAAEKLSFSRFAGFGVDSEYSKLSKKSHKAFVGPPMTSTICCLSE
jgi:hypothetical protein